MQNWSGERRKARRADRRRGRVCYTNGGYFAILHPDARVLVCVCLDAERAAGVHKRLFKVVHKATHALEAGEGSQGARCRVEERRGAMTPVGRWPAGPSVAAHLMFADVGDDVAHEHARAVIGDLDEEEARIGGHSRHEQGEARPGEVTIICL